MVLALRRLRASLLPACLALLVLLASPRRVQAAHTKPVPELSLSDLQGHPQTLSAYRGQIVVLNFWATWCGPCKEEMPRLAALARAYAGRNVAIITVSLDDAKTRPDVTPFLMRESIDLPVWLGADTATLDRFRMGEIVPATLVLDQQGEPVTRIMGEAREADLRQAVDWVLGGRIGAPPPPVVKRY